MGGSPQRLGSLKERVVFQVPGGEGQSPEQEVTPTEPMPQPDMGVPPAVPILLGAGMLVGSIYLIRKLWS